MAPSYTYPITGIIFFLRHPKELWLKTLCPLLLTLVAGGFSFDFSLRYWLPWQEEVLKHLHWPSWIAWVVSLALALLGSALFDILCFAILLPFFKDALFDATLKARGLERILDERPKVSRPVRCCRSISSSALVSVLLVLARVIGLIVTAPLHLIPFLGTVAAAYIHGWPAAWEQHLHYDIELRGWTVTESRQHAWRLRGKYINFGAAAVILELVPIFNLLFMWTNVVGAALWIGDEHNHSEDASVTSIYPSVRSPESAVPSIKSQERAHLLGATAETYGSTSA